MSSKVKDGLFLGDVDAAQDAEFLQLNGIVHIVNCAPRQVPNLFQQSLGLAYVVCDLEEVLRRTFFDLKNRQFMSIVQLIDRALDKTESVLVHSLDGTNRSPSIMIGYLMVKYCWGVDKAYEFLLSKRADMKPHESCIDQLCLLEAQLQTRFGSRAMEQQLYEWHPALADPATDEIVLVHTFLNTPSTAKQVTKKELTKPPSTRRLSWIDQVPHMKKLYPSLMIKPERPPNCSYNEMVPSNGWIDLLTPSNQLAPAPRPMAAFLDPPALEHAAAASSFALAINPNGADDDGDVLVSRDYRVHSFSVPRRCEIEIDNRLSPSSVSSDREGQDMIIDLVRAAPAVSASVKQAIPRYQQQTRSTSSSSSARSSRQAPQQQQMSGRSVTARPSTSAVAPLTSLSSSAVRFSQSLNSSGIASTISSTSSLNKSSATKATDYSKPTKPGMRAASAKQPAFSIASSCNTIKQPSTDRRTSSGSTGSFSARGSFSGELPLSQTSSTFTIRRSIIDTDPWSSGVAQASTAPLSTTNPPNTSTSTRPRTAPPRLRKKDPDATAASGISRVNIDVWSLPAGAGASSSSGSSRRLSTTEAPAPPPLRAQKFQATIKTPTAFASGFVSAAAAGSAARPRASRAQWK